MNDNAQAGCSASGIYGLFRFDGSPIDPASAGALGLALAKQPTFAAARGIDVGAPQSVSRHETGMSLTLLVGEIEESEALAVQLGLARTTGSALIALTALERFGGDTPVHLFGEWSLLHWRQNRRLTLMQSAARRDRICYFINDLQIAVAPELAALSRIAAVGDALDETGLLAQLGRAGLRSAFDDHTMLNNVRQLEPGGSVTVRADGRVERYRAQVLTPQPRWNGSFGDAMSEAESLLRNIMQTRLARTRRPANLLSGGLDSSLLAWLMTAERAPEQAPLCITSAAPPGSGLADETAFAALVADRLGLEHLHAFPLDAANTYRPPDHVLAGAAGPLLSNRHCLTEAFQIAARAAGATMLINGTYGEFSATARLPMVGARHRIRQSLARAYRSIGSAGQAAATADLFHARIAPHRLAALPEPISAAVAARPAQGPWPGEDGLFGFIPGIEKALAQPNAFYPGALRMDFPFRDPRLLRLFAGFPVRMLQAGGPNRPAARHMLEGRLPDAIRLRQQGMPASPDHLVRLGRQAALARDRIAAFRKLEIDDWLDLDWLDQALARVAARGINHHQQANAVQLTALAAEYLYWWRSRA